MKSPNYIQIDGSMLGDSKIAVLLRRHGAVGLAVYLYSLIQINQSNVDSLHLDEGFTECASVVLDITKETLGKVIETLIGIGLLICDGEAYYSHGYTKRTGEYKEANRKRSESQKRNKAAEREGKEIEAVVLPLLPKPKRQPVAKNAITESEEITRLRGYADAIYAQIPNCKNKPCISTSDYQKLIDKWGLTKLTIMQRVYYEWLITLKDKYKHTDFGVLNVGGSNGWISQAADEQIAKEQDSVKRHF